MAKERNGSVRPRNGQKNAAAKRSGGPAIGPPVSPDEPGPSAPPESGAAGVRPGDSREPPPVKAAAPETPESSSPQEPAEDFKLHSSFLPEGEGEVAAESPAQKPVSTPEPAAPAPPSEAAPADPALIAPPAIEFPSEEVWHRSGDEAEESGSDLLCFTIAQEEYAIDIQRVWEIIRLRPVTEIPGVPEFISGIIALRGEIVPVLDLRARLGFPPAEVAYPSAKIVVAIHEGRRIGMAVDAVSHKIHVLDSQMTQPAALLGAHESGFLAGVCRHQGRLIAILKAEAVLAFLVDPAIDADQAIRRVVQEDRGAQGGAR